MSAIDTDMREVINRKETLVNILNKKLDEILGVELDLKTRERNLMDKTNWNDLFKTTNRVTDKQKNAYVEDILKKEYEKLARLKNDVVILKNKIQLCNDEISLCKYIIREKEVV